MLFSRVILIVIRKWSLPKLLPSVFHVHLFAREEDVMVRSKCEIFPEWVSILVPDPSLSITELFLSRTVSIT